MANSAIGGGSMGAAAAFFCAANEGSICCALVLTWVSTPCPAESSAESSTGWLPLALAAPTGAKSAGTISEPKFCGTAAVWLGAEQNYSAPVIDGTITVSSSLSLHIWLDAGITIFVGRTR